MFVFSSSSSMSILAKSSAGSRRETRARARFQMRALKTLKIEHRLQATVGTCDASDNGFDRRFGFRYREGSAAAVDREVRQSDGLVPWRAGPLIQSGHDLGDLMAKKPGATGCRMPHIMRASF